MGPPVSFFFFFLPKPACAPPRGLAIPTGHHLFQLQPNMAAAAYAHLLPPQASEFLPADLPALLAHKLTLGTFMALESGPDSSFPPSFALLSV